MARRKKRKRGNRSAPSPTPPQDTQDQPATDDNPAALATAVLDEEAKRQEAQARRSEIVLPDDLLPGVNDEPMSLKQAMKTGGSYMLFVLFLLNVVDEFPRVIRVLAPDIQNSLEISDTTLLGVLSFGGVAFTLGALPMARLADRVKRTTIIPIATAFWVSATALSGLVTNAFQLFWTNFAIGLGQSYRIPVSNSLLTDTYPIQSRARVFAIESMGRPVGQLIGPITVGAVAAFAGGDDGWRWAFYVIAIPGLIVGFLALFLDEPPRGRFEQEEVLGDRLEPAGPELPISTSAAYERLKKIRTFYYLCVGIGVLGFSLVAVPVQFNLLLDSEYGYGPFQRGVIESLMWAASLLTIPLIGRVMDRRFRRDPALVMRLMGTLVFTAAIVTFVALFFDGIVALVALLALGQALTSAAFVGAPATIAAVAPYRLRAQAFALLPVFVFLMGGFFGGILVGALSDAHGERTAMKIVSLPAGVTAGFLIVYGSQFMRRDISLAVEELLEEKEENERLAEPDAEQPVLQVRNLDFSYGRVQVLFDVALDVQRGETVALLGTNGAGKSTALRVISGLGIPERGVVRLNGRNITFTDAELRVKLGIVQVAGGKATFGDLTVEENLRVGAFTKRRDEAAVAARVEEVYGIFPALRDQRKLAAGDLSGGQQQQLAIAKALLLDPEILIIDELSLGLAPIVIQELLAVVERLKAEGMTMIIVEQSLNVALAVADRAVFMEKGEVRFSGPAQELAERDDLVRAVFLGAEGG